MGENEHGQENRAVSTKLGTDIARPQENRLDAADHQKAHHSHAAEQACWCFGLDSLQPEQHGSQGRKKKQIERINLPQVRR